VKIFRKEPPPATIVIGKSIRKLQVQQHKIKQVSFRLQKRDETLFRRCVHALKSKNKDRATICANEIAEVKKLVKFLYNVELAIERVILRLETMRELSEIILDLKPALKLLQSVTGRLFDVLPNVSSELSEVNDVITETLYATKIRTDASVIPVDTKTPGGEEILKEVANYLEEDIIKRLPEPPATMDVPEEIPVKQLVALAATCSESTGQEIIETENYSSHNLFSLKETELQEVSLRVEKSSLEDALLDYIKRRKGEVDLMQCSVELNTSYNEIEKALQSLGDKGKVKIETEVE
jgi:division protein CdvB (Snf7/Vps24/ESCRT-III family)/predicted CopG family antitoxin